MIGRTVFGLVAALAFAGFMGSVTTAYAKACPALCRVQIKTCKQTECTTKPKGACKRNCKQKFVAACKATSTTPKERTCPATASPSGAFLD